MAFRECALLAEVHGFESEFGCEGQQCGDDDNHSVEQQGLRWPPWSESATRCLATRSRAFAFSIAP